MNLWNLHFEHAEYNWYDFLALWNIQSEEGCAVHKYIADSKKKKKSRLSALASSTVYLVICAATGFGVYKSYCFNRAAFKSEAA